jgi:hypothetical protein
MDNALLGSQESRSRRLINRVLIFVPIFSSLVFCECPTFDDIEKTLNLLGLINTLMIGVVSGSFVPPGESGLSLAEEPLYLQQLFSSFILYAFGMVLIFCTYWNFVMNIEEKYGSDADGATGTDDQRERIVRFAQVRFVWYVSGRILFTLLIGIDVVATVYYVDAVLIYIGSNAWRRSLVYALFYTCIYLSHLAFVPLQWSKLLRREQLKKLPPLFDGWGGNSIRCCGFACPSLDFGQHAAAAVVENVLAQTTQILAPPSQKVSREQSRAPTAATAVNAGL